MIQTNTTLNVADNSGARKLMCIKVLGDSKRRYARIGDLISASVKTAIPGGNIKKGDVIKPLLLELKKNSAERMVVTFVLMKMLR